MHNHKATQHCKWTTHQRLLPTHKAHLLITKHQQVHLEVLKHKLMEHKPQHLLCNLSIHNGGITLLPVLRIHRILLGLDKTKAIREMSRHSYRTMLGNLLMPPVISRLVHRMLCKLQHQMCLNSWYTHQQWDIQSQVLTTKRDHSQQLMEVHNLSWHIWDTPPGSMCNRFRPTISREHPGGSLTLMVS